VQRLFRFGTGKNGIQHARFRFIAAVDRCFPLLAVSSRNGQKVAFRHASPLVKPPLRKDQIFDSRAECGADSEPHWRSRGGGWSNLWGLSAPDRWGSFTRKKLEFNTKSPPELRAISQSANLSISSGCGGLFRAASIRVELAAVALMNVRCWGKSRRHLLSRSFSAFDPGCVKTRLSQGRAELFSQLLSPKRSRWCNRVRQRRN
jgi:hypothetical protein